MPTQLERSTCVIDITPAFSAAGGATPAAAAALRCACSAATSAPLVACCSCADTRGGAAGCSADDCCMDSCTGCVCCCCSGVSGGSSTEPERGCRKAHLGHRRRAELGVTAAEIGAQGLLDAQSASGVELPCRAPVQGVSAAQEPQVSVCA